MLHNNVHLDGLFETFAFELHALISAYFGNWKQLWHEDFLDKNLVLPMILMELKFQMDKALTPGL